LKTEEDSLDPNPPANQTESLEAIRYVEQAVVGAEGTEGIALRYANFYGPGTGLAVDGDIVAQVRKRRFPIVGDGGGVWSFVHMDDAATASIKRNRARSSRRLQRRRR
jgi:nucleoside-diphosphate-sugar epimerase